MRQKLVAAIDALVKFAIDLNIVSISNSDVLFREVGAMNEAIVECLDKSDDVDVSKFFSPAPQEKQEKSASAIDSVVPADRDPSCLCIFPCSSRNLCHPGESRDPGFSDSENT